MKTKNFHKYLEKRLSAEEIATIRAQAELEVKNLRFIQKFITDTIADYMKENKIGFNELGRRLDWSPTKVAKVQRGEANLTMASMAHLFALLGKTPQEVFQNPAHFS